MISPIGCAIQDNQDAEIRQWKILRPSLLFQYSSRKPLACLKEAQGRERKSKEDEWKANCSHPLSCCTDAKTIWVYGGKQALLFKRTKLEVFSFCSFESLKMVPFLPLVLLLFFVVFARSLVDIVFPVLYPDFGIASFHLSIYSIFFFLPGGGLFLLLDAVLEAAKYTACH